MKICTNVKYKLSECLQGFDKWRTKIFYCLYAQSAQSAQSVIPIILSKLHVKHNTVKFKFKF